MTMTENTEFPKPKRRIGRVVGLGVLGLFVVSIGAVAAMYFRVPQRLGIVDYPSERLSQGTPDRVKAAELVQSLQQTGLSTEGVEVYVLPFAGTDREVALVVLDASKGFSFDANLNTNMVKDFVTVVTHAQQLGVDRAAVQYRDENGKDLLSATVATDAVVAYAQGQITDQQLMEKVDIGLGDVPAAIALLQQLNKET